MIPTDAKNGMTEKLLGNEKNVTIKTPSCADRFMHYSGANL
jgi:hypothetical protein